MMNVSSPPHSVARMRWLVHKGNVRHSNEMSPDSYQKGILVEMDTKVSDLVEISRLDYM